MPIQDYFIRGFEQGRSTKEKRVASESAKKRQAYEDEIAAIKVKRDEERYKTEQEQIQNKQAYQEAEDTVKYQVPILKTAKGMTQAPLSWNPDMGRQTGKLDLGLREPYDYEAAGFASKYKGIEKEKQANALELIGKRGEVQKEVKAIPSVANPSESKKTQIDVLTKRKDSLVKRLGGLISSDEKRKINDEISNIDYNINNLAGIKTDAKSGYNTPVKGFGGLGLTPPPK